MEMPLRGSMVLEFPAMVNKLKEIPDGVEWVDEQRKHGGNPRVPVVMVDGIGRHWWMGLRSAYFVNGGERVSVDGKQCRAQRRLMETDKSGEKWFWVVDYSAPVSSGRFFAPLPLASKEDAQAYYKRGVDGLATPAQLADKLGWTGCNAASVAAKFLEVVHAYSRQWQPEAIAAKVAAIPEVVIPASGEGEKARAVTWREMVAMVDGLKAEVETLRGEAKHERGLREDMGREVVRLKAEVAALRGLVI
jgi:hypothetical protein